MRTRPLLLSFSLLAACHTAPPPLTGDRHWSFEDTPSGTLPQGFRVDATRRVGPLATWEVATSKDAPSPSQALSLSYPNHKQYDSFNLCWTPDVQFGDGTLAVKLCARSGKEDQGGGLLWRAQGPDDYYVARLNPLESNLRLYTVKDGNREMLASADVPAKTGEWRALTIEHRGAHIRCAIDGVVVIDLSDTTFPAAGGIGVWTKADAATDFDDLAVTGG